MSSDLKRPLTQIDFGAVPDTSIAAPIQHAPRTPTADRRRRALQKRSASSPLKREAKQRKWQTKDETPAGVRPLVTVQAASDGVSVLEVTAIKQESPWNCFREDYELKFGEFVSVASDRKLPHDSFIIKRFDGPDLAKKLQMLQRVRHNSFHDMRQCFSYENSYYAVFPNMPISLDHVVKSPPYLDEHELAAILGQVVNGLVYLASNGLEHGSLCSSNILLNTKGEIKIAGQECCQEITSSARDIRALGIIAMELMQKYAKVDAAIGVDDLERWPSDCNAVGFLSMTTSATYVDELLDHPLLKSGWEKENIKWIAGLAMGSRRRQSDEGYAIAAGGAVAVVALIHLLPYIFSVVKHVSLSISKHLTYRYILSRHRILGPWTRTGVIVQLVYIAANLFCAGFGASTIRKVGLRAGTLAVVNMIPLFAAPHLAFVADWIGMSLKTIHIAHRSAGFMTFFLGLLHVIVAAASNISLSLDAPRDLFAVIGGSLLCLLILLLFPPFRKLSYELFLRTHQALAVASAYAVWRHLPSDKAFPRVYVYVSAGLFLFMFALQSGSVILHNGIFWYHLSRATITHESGALKVQLHLQKPIKVDDGQYVNLWIPSVSFWSFLQSHPFMVISWEPSEQKTLDLLIEPRKGLTQELLHHASKSYTLNPFIVFSGPHGPHVSMNEHESVLMVASGFGIAAHFSHLKRLIYGYNARLVRARRIHIVWQIRDKVDGLAAQSLLNRALKEDKLDDGCILEVSIYVEAGDVPPEFPFGNRATLYQGTAPLAEIFLTEVSGNYNKTPRMLTAGSNRRSSEKCEAEATRTKGDVEFRKFSLPAKTNELEPSESDLEAGGLKRHSGTVKVLVTLSGSGEMRDNLRKLVRNYLHAGVRLLELEYQPE
ncbi:hypothetical protein O988_05355 [Pseudogymnoascus sp. VKM F-3808]|nr:hypothetical protein O988_05355 [Pseudogymnoascus sp. VKM F-3808]